MGQQARVVRWRSELLLDRHVRIELWIDRMLVALDRRGGGVPRRPRAL
jgi:hypothetical protein